MEGYILETIESIECQQYNSDLIEILVIDDHSTDNTKKVLENKISKTNVKIRLYENPGNGVSSARNFGITKATNEILNFLDADDLLENNCLKVINDFYQKNEQQVDLVSIPLVFFEAKSGNHMLNDKFSDERVIDCVIEPASIQLSSSSCFIKKEIFDQYHLMYDERLSIGEDSKLVTEIIMIRGRYGVTNKTIYHYRKRKASTSVLQNTYETPGYYNDFFHFFIEDIWIKFGDQLYRTYVENVIMYNLQWHIRQKNKPRFMTEEQRDIFLNSICEFLSKFSFETIYGAKFLSYHQKEYILNYKIKRRIEVIDNEVYCFRGETEISSLSKVVLDNVTFQSGIKRCTIIGEVGSIFDINNLHFSFWHGNRRFPCEELVGKQVLMMGKVVKQFKTIRAVVNLNYSLPAEIRVVVTYNQTGIERVVGVRRFKKAKRNMFLKLRFYEGTYFVKFRFMKNKV